MKLTHMITQTINYEMLKMMRQLECGKVYHICTLMPHLEYENNMYK